MDIRLIIATALKCAATSIIIAHNHPSGNLDPSEQDRKSTKSLNQALELFNISLLDHLIIIPNEKVYFIFTDKDEI